MIEDSTATVGGELKLVDSEPGKFAFYTWQNITIVVWPSLATAPAVARLAVVLQSMAEAHPKGMANVQIIPGSAAVPTPEARKGFVELIGKHSKDFSSVEVILLAGGFWASAMRAAVTGISMVVPHPFPLRMHGKMSEAARALAKDNLKRTGGQIDVDNLTSILKTVEREQTAKPIPEKK